ncbi:cation diffusion facilitator family transporter [Paenibacillus silvae]|uniref:cation diffusion facilitator family transporter n=1 Tax=Paenibacillus TaxID=44249 RepID=UPI001C129081|nr:MULTISPECIES: cation diffusion facilitator family transporter [Paenibacillus]MBU5355475.1 cation diffusion facilitator family transporter [Paenibacillus barcinonensis]MDM5276034.1 cation diffusion facilitator family transporter [Paenibacillus silvae]
MTREAGRSAHAATWSGIVGNMALAVIKTGVGYMANSKSLLADGLYSASEAASSLVGLFPSKSVKSKDKVQRERLREHARAARPGMTVLLAVLILMGGLQLAISALGTLSSDEIEAPGRSVLLIAVAALAVKEAIFQFQYRVFRKRNQSQAMSYALQHRRALYCSLIVLIGIIGSMAGEETGLNLLLYLDPITAILASGFIFYKGYRMIVDTVYGSLVQELEQEDATDFKETVQRVYGIITIEHLIAREQEHDVTIELVISVNPRISILEAQEIANRAKTLLLTRFSHVKEVQVQAVPYDPGYPYKSNHELPDHEATLIQ